MPTSMWEGKEWLLPRIAAELDPHAVVLDVGAGEGTYRRHMHAEATWIALEVWEPYVEEYRLRELYDEVIVGDAVLTTFPDVDVVILGDVIEHLDHDDAVTVWGRARRAARRAVFASIPLGEFPQGAVNGNHHETHLTTWTDESVHALGGVVASWVGPTIGAYAVLPA